MEHCARRSTRVASARVARLLLILCVLAGVACRRAPAAPSAVIVLDIDTLGAAQLGLYGYERATSPRLGELAKDAVVFERAFSQAPYTPPSQTSILTSLYPRVHGVGTRHDRLDPRAVTLAESFAAAGYRTAAFTDGAFMSRPFGIDQGFELFDDAGGGLPALAPKVEQYLRTQRKERFFLLVHTYEVHTPYEPAPELARGFVESLAAPPTPGFAPSVEVMEAARKALWQIPSERLPAADLEYARALHDAEILAVDAWIAGLFELLDELEMRAETAVVLLSDHGESFGAHDTLLHEMLYADVTRIPLVFWGPGVRPGRNAEVVEAIDVMPTLLAWAGIEPPPGIQGSSLLAFVRGEPGQRHGRPRAYAESAYFWDKPAVVAERWHLVIDPRSGAPRLFDLDDDLGETRDLATERPDLVDSLRQELAAWRAANDRRAASFRSGSELDPETLEELRALGYVQ